MEKKRVKIKPGPFQDMIDRAKCNTQNDWEDKFIQDMQERFSKYKEETYVSEKQYHILNKIAVRIPMHI